MKSLFTLLELTRFFCSIVKFNLNSITQVTKYTDNIFYYIYHITNHLSMFVNYLITFIILLTLIFISYGIIVQQVSLLIRLICPKNLCINPILIPALINRWLDKFLYLYLCPLKFMSLSNNF